MSRCPRRTTAALRSTAAVTAGAPAPSEKPPLPPQHRTHSSLVAPPCSCLEGRCVCSVVDGKEVAVGPRCSVEGPVPPATPRRAAVVVSPSGVDADGCGSTRQPCASLRHALRVQFWEWARQLAESALARSSPRRPPRRCRSPPVCSGLPSGPDGAEGGQLRPSVTLDAEERLRRRNGAYPQSPVPLSLSWPPRRSAARARRPQRSC